MFLIAVKIGLNYNNHPGKSAKIFQSIDLITQCYCFWLSIEEIIFCVRPTRNNFNTISFIIYVYLYI